MGIKCNNVKKYYGKQLVIDNFNYYFKNMGLYVLYGESGCGKTTLLNLIAGVEELSSGKISIDGVEVKLDNRKMVDKKIAYISQNNYLIDYLNVENNLKLSLLDKKKNTIDEWLKRFNLEDKKYSLLSELSFGEKERVAIITAILQEKEIVLLDEPTSSLDKKNRKNLLTILNELKEQCLIICATHDKELIKIADSVIDVKNITKYKVCNEFDEIKNKAIKSNKDKLGKYMIKQFNYKNREKVSTIILVGIFTIVILIFNMCCKSEEKIEQSLLSYYDINFVNYYCELDGVSKCYDEVNKYNGDNIFLYENVPHGECYDDGYCDTVEYSLKVKTLPLNEKLFFNASDYLLYGTYFNSDRDIILGYDLAKSLSADLESLIDKEYRVILPDGEESFFIVGIFKDVNNEPYFNALLGSNKLGYMEYITDEYVKKYEGCFDEYYYDDYVIMRAYFENIKDLEMFYKENLKCRDNSNICVSKNGLVIQKYENNFIKFSFLIEDLKYYLIPGTIAMFLVSILFFYQMEEGKNNYRGYILAVYKNYGYEWKDILVNNMIVNIIDVIRMYFISLILAEVISKLLNFILIKMEVIKFKLFIEDWQMILLLLITLITLSGIFSLINGYLVKKKSWLMSLKEREDFI